MSTTSNIRDRLGVAAYTQLRVIVGIIMAAHGWFKFRDLAGWQEQVQSLGIPAPEVLAPLAASSELFGGILLILGLLTPFAGVFLFGVLVTAILTVHLSHGLMARNNGFELPLALLSAVTLFIIQGAGRVSLDSWFGHAREKHKRAHHLRRDELSAPLGAERESRA